jgi:hypothetical protein
MFQIIAMQIFLIAILFVILVIALTLGFVIYRISLSATVKDVDRIVDDVNKLQTDLKKSIAKNTSGVLAVTASNNQLKNDYIKLSSSNLVLFTDMGVVKSNTSNLSLVTSSNSSNISRLQTSLTNDYMTTTALNTNLNSRDFSFLHLDDSNNTTISYLKVSDSNLHFCTALNSERNAANRPSENCSRVMFSNPSP